MSYELNILCVNQSNASKLPFASSIELRNEFDYPTSGRYFSIWPFLCSLKGVWYSLGKDDDGWFHAMSIIDADFDRVIGNILTPYWVLDDDVISNLSPIIVNNKYMHDIERTIQFLIQQSPNNAIMFLARYQGGEKEIIQGVLDYKEFIILLNQDKILFNVCYIVGGTGPC
jgi:hypothetical protein